MNQAQQFDRNNVRDYWRSTIVNEVAKQGGHTVVTLQPFIAANASAAKAIVLMIDDLEAQEGHEGVRTLGMHRGVIRQCGVLVSTYHDLRRSSRPGVNPLDEDLFR